MLKEIENDRGQVGVHGFEERKLFEGFRYLNETLQEGPVKVFDSVNSCGSEIC